MSQTLQALVHTLRYEAQDIISVELRPVGSELWPAFTAGSHIDVHLPGGWVRSYSLLNAPDEKNRYVVGVLKDKNSRGGSRAVHEQLRVGAHITITAPRNNFALHEDAAHTVLVAGGIGITPILCMARRLVQLNQPCELVYLARSRQSAAFVDDITALGLPVHWHFDDEQGGPPDLKALLQARGGQGGSGGTHYYACGPAVMLDNFVATCQGLGYNNAHIERFAAVEHKPADDAQQIFSVELKRSGRVIEITPDTSVLHALLAAGVDVDHSCEEGICGACETKVLDGVPDHRDSVLSASEQASNTTMMICVSGCKSERLVLDL